MDNIMDREELRKMIREELEEGTWATPKNKAEALKYVKMTKQLQDKIYKVFGDDDVMDGFDIALRRMEEIIEDQKKIWATQK